MTDYRIEVRVTPREGLLDPQGRAVETALTSLGFDGVESVRIGKLVRMRVEAASEPEAMSRAREMCDRLIANPVIEDYSIRILDENKGDGGGGNA